MAAALRVLAAGPGATIQDGGRYGYLRYGVTTAGPMDWAAFRTANFALGNDDGAAAIEISIGGISVICEDEPLRVAFAGGAFTWRRDGALLPRAARLVLRPGESLSAQAGRLGAWTYLAVEAGFDTPVEMGSRATHVRSGIGGVEGRMLRGGDVLPAAARAASPGAWSEAELDAPWLGRKTQVFGVVLGPQDDYFSAETLATFFSESFTLTTIADRMAYRFAGPPIAHARGYNIVSDGIALGAIQIAGDGAPLILMADRQPTGGYPKLGHVIRADIGELAQMRPGAPCRFSVISVDEARAAFIAREDEVATTVSRLRPLPRAPTSEMLLDANLIDGVINAAEGRS
jgi:biotin-dependent carboxylase-like uncharacterized protein